MAPRLENTLTEAAVVDEMFSDLSAGPQVEAEPEQVGAYSVHGDDLLNEALAEQEGNPFREGASEETKQYDPDAAEGESIGREPAADPFVAAEAQRRNRESQGQPEQEPQQSAPEPTAEELQQTVTVLDTAAQEYGINQNRGAFTSELSQLFNLTAHEAGLDAGALEKPLDRIFISAFDTYVAHRSDLGNIPPLSDAAAKHWTYDFLEGVGLDPRFVSNLDYRVLANTVYGANLSIFATYEQLGGIADVKRLNDPQITEQTVNTILQAMGRPPVSREVAVALGDVYAKAVLRNIQSVQQRQAAMRQAEPRQGQARPSGGRGQRIPKRFQTAMKGQKAPTFRTNSGPRDPFNSEAMAAWQERTGRL